MTTLSVGYPAGIAAGNLLLLVVVQKVSTSTVTTPSGWTAITNGSATGGAGADAGDTGTVKVSTYYKSAIGSESGNLDVTVSGTDGSSGILLQYAKDSGSWQIDAVHGSDNSGGATDWAISGSGSLTIATGDLVIVASGANTDAYTFGSQTLTASGITFEDVFEAIDAGHASNSFDRRLVVSEHAALSGTFSGVPTYAMTASSSGTNAPAGASVIIRLRAGAAFLSAWATRSNQVLY